MGFFSIIIGLIPSLAWLLFYLKEDVAHPEPKRLIALAFFLGGLATVLAFYVESFLNIHLLSSLFTNYSPGHLLSLAFVEELLKLFVIFIFIRRSPHFNEPVDAMIYMITASLGFAAVENAAAAITQWQSFASLTSVSQTVILRFTGATLLHSLSSGLIGYYWARGREAREEFGFLAGGLIVATFVHALFNYLIINSTTLVIPTMLVLIIGLIILSDFEKLKKTL